VSGDASLLWLSVTFFYRIDVLDGFAGIVLAFVNRDAAHMVLPHSGSEAAKCSSRKTPA